MSDSQECRRLFKYHNITENPFGAGEARHDPVFERLIGDNNSHPDFGRILGRIDQPSAAIVFGEKGSGKTAIRLFIGRKVAEHNRAVAADHFGRHAPGRRYTIFVVAVSVPVISRRSVRPRRDRSN